LIDFFARGDEIEVAIFPDRPFTSYFSGNTVQICPVGALTSTPYRFKSRPWDLEQVETTCTFCAVGCRVAMQSSAGTVVRYLGIDSDPVNQSWLCDRGRYGFEAIESADRLTQPMVRRDEELVEVRWHEALEHVGAKIKEAISSQGGPSSIGVIGGARLPNEDQYAWSKLCRAVIGTDNIDAQLGDGLPAELVASLPRATIDEACEAKVVVLLAGDLREELPVLYLRLRNAVAHSDLTIIDCSPAPSALSGVAEEVVPYRSGEAARLAEALFSADAAAHGVPGVRPASLRRAREILAEAGDDVVVVLGRPSLAESPDGLAAAASVVGREVAGARFLLALRRANVHGAIDMGLAPGLLPGRVTLESGREWYEGAWGSLPAGRGLDTRGMLEAAAEGSLKVLVLLGADPLADFPDRELAKRALEKVPFLVAVDTLPSVSAQLADVVLPAGGIGERPGTVTNLEGRVTRLAQKVVSPGVAHPDWVIASEIAERLGLELGLENVEGIWEEIEQVAPSHRGATVAAVYGRGGDDGVVVPVGAVPVGLGVGVAVDLMRVRPALDPIATPGIDSVNEQGAPLFAGAAVIPGGDVRESLAEEGVGIEAIDASPVPERERPMPLTLDTSGWPAPAPPQIDGYSHRLVTRRSLYDRGTLVQASPSLAALCPEDTVHMAT
ncbi:MAG: molybdopterin oxidoreductase family protein, partial [Acidimicrobiales bacterium]